MLTQSLIDIDPELLRRSAPAQLHAFAEVADHLAKEETGHIPTILDTLVSDGPWAWAIVPFTQPDGSFDLPLQTTYEGIEEMYGMIRGHSDVLGTEILNEARGTWYMFAEVRVEAIARAGERKGSRVAFHTGELFIPGRENKFMVQLGHGTDLAESETGQPASAMAEAAG